MAQLFSDIDSSNLNSDTIKPEHMTLAARMRPTTLDEIVGQEEAIGKDSWLYCAIKSDSLSSIILYGPAGTGKTTIAKVIANYTKATFVEVSAIAGKVSDLRREIDNAKQRLYANDVRTILFVDEIHRFNRGQQDALLHAVEDNIVILIGATTENPFFEVNSALNSRSRIIQLNALSDTDVATIIKRAVKSDKGLAGKFKLAKDAGSAITLLSGGDARTALNILENASYLAARNKGKDKDTITIGNVNTAMPNRQIPYDKDKDMHYDIISAFIKSMRGGDPDAAVYWMARMLEGGEDPKFIARRIYICASEDVGNADPQALLVASAAFKAVEVIGMPEARINLAQAAIYIAMAPKSNACVMAIDSASDEIKHGPVRSVPNNLRDRHRPGAETYGQYKYPHDYPGAWVNQQYLPDGLEKGCFYQPTDRGWEGYRKDINRNRENL